jgi:hypothetical protein
MIRGRMKVHTQRGEVVKVRTDDTHPRIVVEPRLPKPRHRRVFNIRRCDLMLEGFPDCT